MKIPLLVAALSVVFPVFAWADVLSLKDGRFVGSARIQKVEKGFKLTFKNGEIFVPVELVRDCLIEGQETYEPQTEEEKAKVAKGLVPFEGKWLSRAERDNLVAKRIAERKKKLEDARAHREWRNRYIAAGKEFQYEFTIDPDVAQGFQDLLETYYKVFTKQWGIQKPAKFGKLKVCFYHDPDTFYQVTGVGRGTLAYYRFVEPVELNFYFDRIDPLATIDTMFHEANHHLTHLIDLDFHYPHCVNEAMAEYYGASHWDPVKKEMTMGHILEGRLTEVLTDIQGGEWRKLEDYLQNKLGYYNYTWGWSFVHFMMETPKYQPKWKAFYLALARAKDVKRVEGDFGLKIVEGPEILRAFKQYIGIKDIEALEKEWHDYIKNKLQLKTHRGFEDAGLAALRTGQPLKAKRFLKMAVEKGSTNPIVYKRYADLMRADDNDKEAEKLILRAIELDPLNGQFFADLGRLYRQEKSEAKKKEGDRLRKLALELDPDNLDIALDDAMEKAGKVPSK